MATRQQVRQCVVSMLYAAQMGGDNGDFSEFLDEQKVKHSQREWCFELYNGVRGNCDKLDEMCDEFLETWKMEQVGIVERNILRLGVFELAFTQTQSAIVISQALWLANSLANTPSVKMINGVLDKVRIKLGK